MALRRVHVFDIGFGSLKDEILQFLEREGQFSSTNIKNRHHGDRGENEKPK